MNKIKKSNASGSFSGRVLLRMPKTLHAKLVLRAKQEGVSLNQLILSLVAEGLGQRNATQKRAFRRPSPSMA